MGLIQDRSSSSSSSPSASSSSVADSLYQMAKQPNKTLREFLNGQSSDSGTIYETLLEVMTKAQEIMKEAEKKAGDNSEEGRRRAVNQTINFIRSNVNKIDHQITQTSADIKKLEGDLETLEARSKCPAPQKLDTKLREFFSS
ncbi:hypothetical protein [Candidatus Finniella inopinata]|nr:hypothetical protein [Candidatus Finniella inopinata]